MCSATSRVILPEPPEELKRVSEKLAAAIREKICQEGPISFSDYMEMALYEPGLGYYSAGLQKFGKGGDFVTAPQLGNTFARCLATQIEQIGTAIGGYEIIEAGAGTGVLAADLLTTLQDSHPPERYRILERSAHLRQVQKETLERSAPQWMDRISWLDQPPEAGWQGVFIANEVLDALTVERFCCDLDGIRQLRVADGPDGFVWHQADCPRAMRERIQTVLSGHKGPSADGYQSEINTSLPAWLQTVSASLQKGVALFIDYGYPRHEYYLPQRRNGTLICHYRHRAHDDPFLWPGLTDISASVDFTALAEAADSCSLEVSGYTTQAMFLLSCGLEEVISSFQSLSEKDRVVSNIEVRKLTLPGEMGERFQVMALSRDLDEDVRDELRGFALTDLRYRL
ncbi:MAG: SAM-dependent methyltransferase [Gammaproteobacteria bacterium]|nr:MAG: SAM-dependent methyltransferase [Gammaproteobacteria bacterium]